MSHRFEWLPILEEAAAVFHCLWLAQSLALLQALHALVVPVALLDLAGELC